ncbi:MAG: hypothetical protein R2854_26890 [Caldilineaceae bacterium]
MDALTRADREAELEDWLDAAGLEDSWEVAPGLVNMGLAPHDLERLAAQFDAAQLAHVLDWAVNHYTVHSVLREISEGSGAWPRSSRRSRPSPIWIRRRYRMWTSMRGWTTRSSSCATS